MSALKLKHFALKRYYIFDWNGEDGWKKVFRKSIYRYLPNILRSILQSC